MCAFIHIYTCTSLFVTLTYIFHSHAGEEPIGKGFLQEFKRCATNHKHKTPTNVENWHGPFKDPEGFNYCSKHSFASVEVDCAS